MYVRDTGHKLICYQIIKSDSEFSQINISGDTDLIEALLRKTQYKKLANLCSKNITTLSKASRKYHPINFDSILSVKQRQVLADIYRNKPPAPYPKAPFDPAKHIHETVCGELVRSKSEVIIANALWHYGIPFNYEEMFPYPDDDGTFYYPDFTIHCPDGTILRWEHWGMLGRQVYCSHNAGKLYTYNKHGCVIGKDLIITQDDSRGNCCSELVYTIIEKFILPHFQ